MSLFSHLSGQIDVCPKSKGEASGMLAGYLVMPQFLDLDAEYTGRAVVWS